jgi:hypothetical protein
VNCPRGLRLGAGKVAGGSHQRLVEKPQLFAGQCTTKVVFGVETTFDAGLHVSVEEHIARAASTLGRIHGEVGRT